LTADIELTNCAWNEDECWAFRTSNVQEFRCGNSLNRTEALNDANNRYYDSDCSIPSVFEYSSSVLSYVQPLLCNVGVELDTDFTGSSN